MTLHIALATFYLISIQDENRQQQGEQSTAVQPPRASPSHVATIETTEEDQTSVKSPLTGGNQNTGDYLQSKHLLYGNLCFATISTPKRSYCSFLYSMDTLASFFT